MSSKQQNRSIEAEMFLPSAQTIEFEKALYTKMAIPLHVLPEPIDIKAIESRKIECWKEPLNRNPQSIFTFSSGGHTYIGRKLISTLKLAEKLKELNCSRITASMIWGISKGFELSDKEVAIFYHPLTPGERKQLFNKTKNDIQVDIYHPFVFLDEQYKERQSPPSGWTLDITRGENLALGEQHLRAATLQFLKDEKLAGKIVYDPACSTGLFLKTIQQAFPKCVTIGQDLSKDMIDYAKQHLDQVILGDAHSPGVPNNYCDYVFVRFLNSEVVTRDQAYSIFGALLKTLKQNGKLIIFGHTPVLLKIPYLESLYNLKSLRRIGLDEQEDTIFQYYILQKK